MQRALSILFNVFTFLTFICLTSTTTTANEVAYLSNQDGDIELYVLTKDSKKPKQITHDSLDDMAPCINSDGEVYVTIGRTKTRNYVKISNKNGKLIKKIMPTTGLVTSLACFRSKNQIVYSISTDDTHKVAIANLTTSEENAVYEGPNSIQSLQPNNAMTHIAFIESIGRTSNLKILNLKTNGTDTFFNDKKYTIADFDWSPDNKQLIVSAKNERKFNLWIVNLEKNTQQQWTDSPTIDTSPKYSPSGLEVAWLSNELDGTRLQIVLSKAHKPEPKAITEKGVEVRDVAWATDNKSLIYSAYRDKQFRLFEYVLETKTEQKIAPNGQNFQIMPFFIPNNN